MIYLNEWTNEWTNECNEWTNECNEWTNEWTNECNEWTNKCNEWTNEWDHWVEDIENCEFPDQYIMIDSKIICVNNILDQPHLINFQKINQMTKDKEKNKERLRQIILTDIQLEQINKKKRDQTKRDFEIDEWTRTQLYNDSYIIDIEGGEGGEGEGEGGGEDIECIKKKKVFEYFTEIIQTTYLFISAIRYL
jgi:hypothetical protein